MFEAVSWSIFVYIIAFYCGYRLESNNRELREIKGNQEQIMKVLRIQKKEL